MTIEHRQQQEQEQEQEQIQQQQNHSVDIESQAANPAPSNAQGGHWLRNSRDALLVVMTLVTTLSFQLGVTPPGGFWPDSADGHVAGDAIMLTMNPGKHRALRIFTSLCFYQSVGLILILLSGTEVNRRFFCGIFVFCLADTLFMFEASQSNEGLMWAFIAWGCLMVWGVYISVISKKDKE